MIEKVENAIRKYIDKNNIDFIKYLREKKIDKKSNDKQKELDDLFFYDYGVIFGSAWETLELYKNNLADQVTEVVWGPWIDTLKIYKVLYPNLENYTLSYLKSVFSLEGSVKELSSRLCKRTAVKQHESMYDCIVTYLLLHRLKEHIDLKLFLI